MSLEPEPAPGAGPSRDALGEPPDAVRPAADPVPVVLAGAHGFGRQHLAVLRRLTAAGRARLVGVCDLTPLPEAELDGLGAPAQGTDLAALLAETGAAVTVLATPIHTHADLALTAARHGSHVLLEKPPFASWAEFETLTAAMRETGRACQVGFQTVASPAMRAVRRMVDEGHIGRLRGIGAAANWHRTAAYYDRADWAGRRRLDGRDVVDGVLTNPLAHSVAAALWLAGATGPDDLASIETELFRGNPIEADDTSAVRLRTADGTVLVIAATTCSPTQEKPYLLLQGDEGSLTYWFNAHRVRLDRPGRQPVVTEYQARNPLENLLDHVASGTPLQVPLEETAGFMRVLEAVRVAPEPREIGAPWARRVGEGLDAYTEVEGVGELVTSAAEKLALFSELGVPWAR